MFYSEYCEIFKNTYFEEHLRTAPSGRSIQQKIVIAWKYFRKTLQYVWQGCKYRRTFEYLGVLNMLRIMNMSGFRIMNMSGLVSIQSVCLFGVINQ